MTLEELAAIADGFVPVVREYVNETLELATAGLQDVTTRVAVVEAYDARLVRAEATLDALTDLLGAVRERLAVLETRPTEPGPAGPPGQDGRPGLDGKAGLEYCGVYAEGTAYDVGAVVTWAGSTWHCNEPTSTKPGDGLKAWTLMVKRGRDGKDGKGV